MEFKKLLIFTTILLLFVSCKKENPISTSNNPGGNKGNISLSQYPAPSKKYNFGIMGIDGHVIPTFGPYGFGWSAAIQCLFWSDTLNFISAKSNAYNPLFGYINRDSVLKSNWKSVYAQINWGINHGANYFYIDDAFGDGVTGVTQSQIDNVAQYIHNLGYRLATSEYNTALVTTNYHQHVDIIMPYEYDFSPSRLRDFFSSIRTKYPTKDLVPFLGYHADIPGTNPVQFYPNQLGSLGGGNGCLEVAMTYTTMNLVFYYTWPGNNSTDYLDTLTTYLQKYYFLGWGYK